MRVPKTPTQRIDWETPQWLFDLLDEEFRFTLDVCADAMNHKVAKYYDLAANGLRQPWSGMCWMNPPYGAGIEKWLKKAYDTACSGDATVVSLIPSSTGNSWWEYVTKAEARFVRGRIAFVGAETGGMFDSTLAIFHAHLDPGGIMKVWNPRIPKEQEHLWEGTRRVLTQR